MKYAAGASTANQLYSNTADAERSHQQSNSLNRGFLRDCWREALEVEANDDLLTVIILRNHRHRNS